MRIDVWYGKRQRFGFNGLPQQWVNVLGRVRGPVEKLTYSLNGGPRMPLSIGPDRRRLPGRRATGTRPVDRACLAIPCGPGSPTRRPR